jgi:hypothetical protein
MCLTENYTTKTHGVAAVQLQAFLNWTLDRGKQLASRLSLFTPGKLAPGTQRTGGSVGQRAGLDTLENNKISFPC